MECDLFCRVCHAQQKPEADADRLREYHAWRLILDSGHLQQIQRDLNIVNEQSSQDHALLAQALADLSFADGYLQHARTGRPFTASGPRSFAATLKLLKDRLSGDSSETTS